MAADLAAQIRSGLIAQSFPILPSTAFLQSLVANRHPLPALPSLIATAKARLLASDLTAPHLLDPASSILLPSSLANAETKETRLSQDTVLQVLDVENLTKSRWEQVEELEAIERGEQKVGRRVVRLPTAEEQDEEDGDVGPGLAASSGPGGGRGLAQEASTQQGTSQQGRGGGGNATHRLVLQDSKGSQIYALELKPLSRIGVGKTQIGEKILLKRGCVVARGTVLLQPDSCILLGGKVEAWQAAWVAGRLKRLREAIGAEVGPR